MKQSTMEQYIIFALLILWILLVHWKSRQLGHDRWITWLIYGAPAILIVACPFMRTYLNIIEGGNHGWDFFHGYYRAAVMVHNGATSELYNPEPPHKIGLGFVNIPIVVLLFLPFATLPKIQAFIAFSCLGLLAILLAGYVLARGGTNQQKLFIALLFLFSGPLAISVAYGNLSHFLLLPLLAMFYWPQSKRDFGMGVLLAVCVLNKPFLLLFGIYFFAKKRWKVLAGLVMTLVATFGLSLYLFGIDLNVTWLELLNQFNKPMSAYMNQSINGFLLRLLVNQDLMNWLPQEVNWQFRLAKYALLGVLVSLVAWILLRAGAPRSPGEQNLELSIVLCLAIIIAPIAWSHYYLLLLIPYSLYITDRLAVPKG